nr:unnamed protein product [Callosobruchus analis]
MRDQNPFTKSSTNSTISPQSSSQYTLSATSSSLTSVIATATTIIEERAVIVVQVSNSEAVPLPKRTGTATAVWQHRRNRQPSTRLTPICSATIYAFRNPDQTPINGGNGYDPDT